MNDLLIACDQQKNTVLLLLDRFAAFDTVDQAKLTILRNEIDINRYCTQKWFKSFLTERCQKVMIGQSYSEEAKLSFWFSTGLRTGPI